MQKSRDKHRAEVIVQWGRHKSCTKLTWIRSVASQIVPEPSRSDPWVKARCKPWALEGLTAKTQTNNQKKCTLNNTPPSSHFSTLPQRVIQGKRPRVLKGQLSNQMFPKTAYFIFTQVMGWGGLICYMEPNTSSMFVLMSITYWKKASPLAKVHAIATVLRRATIPRILGFFCPGDIEADQRKTRSHANLAGTCPDFIQHLLSNRFFSKVLYSLIWLLTAALYLFVITFVSCGTLSG